MGMSNNTRQQTNKYRKQSVDENADKVYIHNTDDGRQAMGRVKLWKWLRICLA